MCNQYRERKKARKALLELCSQPYRMRSRCLSSYLLRLPAAREEVSLLLVTYREAILSRLLLWFLHFARKASRCSYGSRDVAVSETRARWEQPKVVAKSNRTRPS